MFLEVFIFLYPFVALTYGGNSDMCEKIEAIQDFDAKKTEGIWYAQEGSGNSESYLGDCAKFDITGDKGLVRTSKRMDGEYKYENLTIIQQGNTSKFKLKSGPTMSHTHYWVATDYDNFAIYYGCSMGKGTVDISTRTRNPGAEIMGKAKEAMKTKGFNQDNMTAIKQNDCTN